ncbi:unnamed protein product [Mycena citricolor]|uniref:Uncharacterized protein n=1 Tax=Mycena citricolor TaxID=2018698 RepID=A0AAD2H6A8_9AGAR|nr:unnamed protein product [Mycena citricolor]
MDSQLTLVDRDPPVRLTFGPDSMTNALVSCGGVRRYRIATRLHGFRTEIREVGPGGEDADAAEPAVVISRREVLKDTIRFRGGKEVKIAQWMRKTKLAGRVAYVVENELGSFTLRVDPVYRLALFADFDSETPIAHWSETDAATLVIDLPGPAAPETHLEILAAFTIQELRLRMLEKAAIVAQRRASIGLGSRGGSKLLSS